MHRSGALFPDISQGSAAAGRKVENNPGGQMRILEPAMTIILHNLNYWHHSCSRKAKMSLLPTTITGREIGHGMGDYERRRAERAAEAATASKS